MDISASLPIASDQGQQSLHLARAERMGWLVRLRWAALASVLAGAVAAPWLGFRDIGYPVLFGAVAAGLSLIHI